MTLRLADHWVWDSWYAHDGEYHHAFFLRASRALGDPHRRHARAGVGHAVSCDLRTWRLLPDALVHADAPAWDDLAIWTGSVVSDQDGRWHLFYSAISRADSTPVQRIGRAISDDLVTWHRAGQEPVVVADPRWYEIGAADGTAWRDPWVFADPSGDGWHMLITARSDAGDPAGRGVVGHARSTDLVEWIVGPPLSRPAGFSALEVPQVADVDGHCVLLFSCNPADPTPDRRASAPGGSVWVVEASSIVGPFDVDQATAFAHPSLYAGRLVSNGDGEWSIIGFRDVEDGKFHGELIDPIPVRYNASTGLVALS